MSQSFRNIVYCSDRSGTAKWRRIWPIQSIDCLAQGLNLQVDYSQTPILDQNYYKGMTSVTIQRWISDQQLTLVTKFLKPLCDANSAYLVYEIDDAMSDKDIPLFNRGRGAFEGEKVQSNIKAMLQAADFVTVTTDYIKQYYHKNYDVPLENIIAIPNLLPKYLFGDRYSKDVKLAQFRKNKQKPRIGIVSSLSHYNVDDVREDENGKAVRKSKNAEGKEVWLNEKKEEVSEASIKKITDDLDEIVSCIRETVNDFNWVFFGFCPPKLNDLVKAGKIEVHGGTAIMNYPSILEQLQLQAIVAPIKDMEFNRCKSFIKYMEAAAIGVPLFASNYLPYNRIMPKAQLFDDGAQLKAKLQQLKFASTGIYEDIIERQWKWLNSPTHEGDFSLKSYWLEDNLSIWLDMFRLRQKTLPVSIAKFSEQYEARKKEAEKNTIYKGEDGVTITR